MVCCGTRRSAAFCSTARLAPNLAPEPDFAASLAATAAARFAPMEAVENSKAAAAMTAMADLEGDHMFPE